MTIKNERNNPSMDQEALNLALRLLAIRLDANQSESYGLVVCGGSALILAGLVPRTTKDVDVVALMKGEALTAPDPIPADLEKAVREVAEDLNLPANWLNNGPSRGEGGLFQMGLPDGFSERLQRIHFGNRLDVYFIQRVDQIHFKLYAAVDRGGYHITDLKALNPTSEELITAARWAMTHDVSEPFAMLLKNLIREMGYEDAAERI